jgi:hypothetical protein
MGLDTCEYGFGTNSHGSNYCLYIILAFNHLNVENMMTLKSGVLYIY